MSSAGSCLSEISSYKSWKIDGEGLEISQNDPIKEQEKQHVKCVSLTRDKEVNNNIESNNNVESNIGIKMISHPKCCVSKMWVKNRKVSEWILGDYSDEQW